MRQAEEEVRRKHQDVMETARREREKELVQREAELSAQLESKLREEARAARREEQVRCSLESGQAKAKQQLAKQAKQQTPPPSPSLRVQVMQLQSRSSFPNARPMQRDLDDLRSALPLSTRERRPLRAIGRWRDRGARRC